MKIMAVKAKSTPKAIADALAPTFNEIAAQPAKPTGDDRPIEDPRHLSYVEAVRAYATEHYNDEGMAWDEVVEAWSDWDIVHATWYCRSPQGAINKVSRLVAAKGAYRDEIVNA